MKRYNSFVAALLSSLGVEELLVELISIDSEESLAVERQVDQTTRSGGEDVVDIRRIEVRAIKRNEGLKPLSNIHDIDKSLTSETCGIRNANIRHNHIVGLFGSCGRVITCDIDSDHLDDGIAISRVEDVQTCFDVGAKEPNQSETILRYSCPCAVDCEDLQLNGIDDVLHTTARRNDNPRGKSKAQRVGTDGGVDGGVFTGGGVVVPSIAKSNETREATDLNEVVVTVFQEKSSTGEDSTHGVDESGIGSIDRDVLMQEVAQGRHTGLGINDYGEIGALVVAADNGEILALVDKSVHNVIEGRIDDLVLAGGKTIELLSGAAHLVERDANVLVCEVAKILGHHVLGFGNEGAVGDVEATAVLVGERTMSKESENENKKNRDEAER